MSRSDPRISSFLAERIAAGDFPSAVYLVAEGGRAALADALGQAVVDPVSIAATLETIYDLASLTKPLITGLLCARRIEQRQLALDDAVATYLPEFDRAGKRAITIRHLVTHTAGLPAWRPLYLMTGGEPARALDVIADQPLESAPGTRVTYSDLGFIALGVILERLADASIADLAQREIFTPLGLRRTFFNPGLARRQEIAASEKGNLYEAGMVGDERRPQGPDARAGLIWGEAHDGNAWFLGGAAGHAGLFSTARETFRLAEQFIAERSQLLGPATCALFRENMTPGLNEARSLAWQLAATRDSTAGPDLPPDSFGHTGFTGTSCWIDAARARVFILLTNRTHNHPLPFVNINGVRRRFHTLAVGALNQAAEQLK
jgi:CubicO group peptidase (beta-lactamase class C family)